MNPYLRRAVSHGAVIVEFFFPFSTFNPQTRILFLLVPWIFKLT